MSFYSRDLYGEKMLGHKKAVMCLFIIVIALFIFTEISIAKDAYVVKIIDGDSLLVQREDGQKVQFRLYGIDAPEYGQRYSKNAKIYLQNNLLGKTVQYTKVTKDKYKREIVIVRQKGKTINEELVRKGYAWVYPRYCKKKVCKKWKNLEKRAQARKYGLWQDSTPLSPWSWRHK